MYTREEEAIHYMFKALNNQKRKKEDIALAFHSVSVAAMLLEEGCSKEIVLSGLLHDVIEDGNCTYEEVSIKFGKDIADNVMMLSEDVSIKDFKMRKIEFMNRLKDVPRDIVIAEIADKLQNLLSDYELYKRDGKSALATLSTTYEMNKWYYLEMLKIFEKRIDNSKLLDRYRKIVNIYFCDEEEE